MFLAESSLYGGFDNRIGKAIVDRLLGKPAAIEKRTGYRRDQIGGRLASWSLASGLGALDDGVEGRHEALMQLGLHGGDFRIAFCGVNDRWIDRSPRGGLKLLREICRESVNVAAQGSRIGRLMCVPESRTGVNQQGRTRRPMPINRRL